MARICDISGKKLLSGNKVSHACNKTRRKFYPNLIDKKFYLEEKGVWIQMRVAASTLRTINKNGLYAVLKKAYLKKTLNPSLRSLVELLKHLPPLSSTTAQQRTEA